MLLKDNVHVNVMDGNLTALHVAASRGETFIVQLLVYVNADVHFLARVENFGFTLQLTALHL